MNEVTKRELTPRELEALQLAADGFDSLRIAQKWGYRQAERNSDSGPSHVRSVLGRVRDKLGADNTTQAVAMAIRRGLIS